MITTRKGLGLNNKIKEIEDEVYNTGEKERDIEIYGFPNSEERKTYFFNLGKKCGELRNEKRSLKKVLSFVSDDFENIKLYL